MKPCECVIDDVAVHVKFSSCGNQSLWSPFVRFAVVAIMMTTVLGCSSSDRPKTIRVTGTVTFDGAPPQYPGALYFAPLEVEEGYPRRGGRAIFDSDGAFQATSFDPGDGLVPGTYRVRIESWKKPPVMGKPGVSYVPDGFEAEDLVVSSAEKRIEYNLDVSK